MTKPVCFPPEPGKTLRLEPGIRLVLAANPSPMTLYGTNSYILGHGRVAVIDPGPADPAHLQAILAALEPGEAISHILVTHAHVDHSPLAPALSQATGAPVLGFGPAAAGRSATMATLAAAGGIGGGEGVDHGFVPDISLADGAVIAGQGWQLAAVHTPGHFAGHLSFVAGDAGFCGDHVMGWSTSLVSPPDGDMGAYMASLERLAALGLARLYPGHGAPITDPAGRIGELTAHRRQREDQIRITLARAALAGASADAETLARAIYIDTPDALMGAAARNVFAHLLDLMERGLAEPIGELGFTSRFRLR